MEEEEEGAGFGRGSSFDLTWLTTLLDYGDGSSLGGRSVDCVCCSILRMKAPDCSYSWKIDDCACICVDLKIVK